MYTKLEVLPDVTGAIGSGSLLMWAQLDSARVTMVRSDHQTHGLL